MRGIKRLILQHPGLLRDKCLVAGRWVADEDGRTIDVEDPAMRTVVAAVPNLGASHALAAVSAAQQAFPIWAALPAAARSDILRRWYSHVHGVYRHWLTPDGPIGTNS